MLIRDNAVIPNKSIFKAQEVCALLDIKSYVLRFWESEFEQISPVLSSSGQKLFERKDIEAICLVKKLLFEDKLTIEKAKVEIDRIYSQIVIGEGLAPGAFRVGHSLNSDESVSGFDLDEEDHEKLDLAKLTLFNLINDANSIKEKYSWS